MNKHLHEKVCSGPKFKECEYCGEQVPSDYFQIDYHLDNECPQFKQGKSNFNQDD